ncbi:MAG: DegQ family serine endoprotease [Gemmatimonadaceae bacterium]
MSRPFPRARFLAGVVIAFACGLVFASAFDFTRFGYAQQGTNSAPKPTPQEVRPLAEASNAFVTISEHVTPAVVSIQIEKDARARRADPRLRRGIPPGMEEFFRQFEGPPQRQGPEEATGSGFIVSKDGYILTNNHVVADADRVTVRLTDNRTFKAKVVGRDPTTDVAVIKIDGTALPTVNMGDDNAARVGEWVLAIGNPLGLDFTVTAGIVSAKGRSVQGLNAATYAISDFIQTDAAINPGNSGGPLVNIHGEVIGINSAIASQTGYYSGYGFAIPITLAKDVMNDLIAYGKVRRAILGVSINEVAAEDAAAAGLKEIRGVKVGGYTNDESPAKKAGLEPGDIVVVADGRPVDRVSTLQRIVRAHKPGDALKVEAVRYGSRKSFTIKLAEAPSDDQVASRTSRGGKSDENAPGESRSYDKLGISVEPAASADLGSAQVSADARRGLLVTSVATSGPSYRKILERDILVQVLSPEPKRPLRSMADLEQILSKVKDGQYLSLLVYNVEVGQTRVVNLRIGG